MEIKKTPSKTLTWTGRIISILCVLFLLLDGIMKVVKSNLSMEGSVQLGWPENAVQPIGILLVICVILYSIPRTAILGAILISGYLGGATAIMVRADLPGHPYFFPILFGILVWAGLFLRDDKLRALIPFRKP
jgi:DoxX-like family